MVKHIQAIRRQIAKALVIHKNLTLQCLVSTKRPHILKQILTTHIHTYTQTSSFQWTAGTEE